MIELPRSDQALQVCRDHAAQASLSHSYLGWYQIEAVLASYVASTIYAELEAKIVEIVANVVRSKENVRVHSFGVVASRRIIRSIKISDLSGVLGHFDECCKKNFASSLSGEQKSAWDDLITYRHAVAHDSGSQQTYTLNDVAEKYSKVKCVLSLFSESLCVSCPHLS